MPSCGVCVSVLSRSWIMSKRINTSSIFFSLSGSPTILVFPYQRGWRCSDGNSHIGPGASNAGGVGKKTRFWTNIWLRYIQVYSNLPGAAAPVLQTNFRAYQARGPGGPSVHKEAHLPLTFPFKNCFEAVHSLNVDIFLLQPIPSVDEPKSRTSREV